ncbi:MAG: hypothetical protein ACD_47C00244G0001 [uncultured bacterium]|nr:MAG: hypothetical protein ACD_47C00244G0001 [uncultured bacterium]
MGLRTVEQIVEEPISKASETAISFMTSAICDSLMAKGISATKVFTPRSFSSDSMW